MNVYKRIHTHTNVLVCWDMALTTHPHPQGDSGKGSTTPLPLLRAIMSCYRVAFTYTDLCSYRQFVAAHIFGPHSIRVVFLLDYLLQLLVHGCQVLLYFLWSLISSCQGC